MPSSVRPKAAACGRPAPAAPMSERQQLALLMQMTSPGGEGARPGRTASPSAAARSRDRNEKGETPLHLAAIRGDSEHLGRLLAQRADPNAADFAGWTALHEACNHGFYDIALKLIESGANVNAKGFDNDTPLHDAASNGHVLLIKLLVENGADINAKNSKGKSPIDYAAPTIAQFMRNPTLPLPESATSSRVQPRARDDKKLTGEATTPKTKMVDENAMETSKPIVAPSTAAPTQSDDIYEFKSTTTTTTTTTSTPTPICSKESETIASVIDIKQQTVGGEGETAEMTGNETNDSGAMVGVTQGTEDGGKRAFSEVGDAKEETNEEESRRKKRKEEGGGNGGAGKEVKGAGQRGVGAGKGQAGKHSGGQGKQAAPGGTKNGEKGGKSPCTSPKPQSEPESDEPKADLKVPPLKIVLPSTTAANVTPPSLSELETLRSNKNQPKPIDPPTSQASTASVSQAKPPPIEKIDEKSKDTPNATNATCASNVSGNGQTSDEQQRHQRVLRSSHRSGQAAPDRGSNNSSPQLLQQRSHSPSPSASPAAPSVPVEATATVAVKVEEGEGVGGAPGSSNATVELHPRKRKMKTSREVVEQTTVETGEAQVHPHDQPITNCYQLFMNIRKQIEKRRRGLFPVQPKPPQGFKDYLMNRCTYVLASNAPTTPNISYPPALPLQMKELFTEQEKDRYRLRTQHVIEKEKLVLSVEQEILRVHGRAARALANQSLPFSVCTILRDEEVYNLITPEQEEKDRNARSRYNGRLFLSWLQDVDDKWEKIKEHMLLRHHNEAESLHAVQKMDWEWKMKELSLCDRKSTPAIDEHHVPMVHVSDDFDLLPA